MLEFAEVSLDEVTLPVDVPGDGPLDLSVALGRDVGLCPHGLNLVDEGAGIIAPVGHHVAGVFQAGDQLRARRLVSGLSGRQGQPDRQAPLIDHGMDLGAQSPARETDGVIFAPLFPPAACWWARMMELSMKAMDSGLRSARALKTLTQMPAFAHLLNRL